MKRFRNKDTGMIWYAQDKEHIKELSKNPNFEEVEETKEVKEVEVDKEESTEESESSSTDDTSVKINKKGKRK